MFINLIVVMGDGPMDVNICQKLSNYTLYVCSFSFTPQWSYKNKVENINLKNQNNEIGILGIFLKGDSL